MSGQDESDLLSGHINDVTGLVPRGGGKEVIRRRKCQVHDGVLVGGNLKLWSGKFGSGIEKTDAARFVADCGKG